MYLHAGLGTGPVVQGKIRVNGEYHLKRFVARNLKPIFPLSWKLELAGDLLVRVEGHGIPAAVADEGARVDVEGSCQLILNKLLFKNLHLTMLSILMVLLRSLFVR